jgi:hypothetical protein
MKHKGDGCKKLGNNTWLIEDEEIRGDDRLTVFHFRLHDTDILTFSEETITIRCGGWYTYTTKDRLNSLLPLGLNVWQKDRQWYLNTPHGEVPFIDGMKVDWEGRVVSPSCLMLKTEDLAKKALKKKIDKYIKNFRKKLKAGEVGQPGPGDCFYCLMVDTKSGKPVPNKDHLLSHIDEDYHVPSLLFTAIKEAGYRDPSFIWWHGSVDQKMRALRRYLYAQLGFGT